MRINEVNKARKSGDRLMERKRERRITWERDEVREGEWLWVREIATESENESQSAVTQGPSSFMQIDQQ